MHDRIKLELRGHNHPFAYLIKSSEKPVKSSNAVSNKKQDLALSDSNQNCKSNEDFDLQIKSFIDNIDEKMADNPSTSLN